MIFLFFLNSKLPFGFFTPFGKVVKICNSISDFELAWHLSMPSFIKFGFKSCPWEGLGFCGDGDRQTREGR